MKAGGLPHLVTNLRDGADDSVEIDKDLGTLVHLGEGGAE